MKLLIKNRDLKVNPRFIKLLKEFTFRMTHFIRNFTNLHQFIKG